VAARLQTVCPTDQVPINRLWSRPANQPLPAPAVCVQPQCEVPGQLIMTRARAPLIG
jgi:hypothetical protein